MSKENEDQNKKPNRVKTFPVPTGLKEIKDNITISSNTIDNQSKEKIINQAINKHIQGNISEALKLYQYCINNGLNDQRVFSNYGLLLRDLGRLDIAEKYVRKAIKLKPDFSDAFSNLGLILKDLGKLEEAEIYLTKSIKLNPSSAQAHLNLGNILIDLGNLIEAESTTRKAIDINPDFANAHYNLGIILKYLSNLKEAEVSTRKAIELNPNFANAHLNLANILIDIDKIKEAEISTRKAIELNPNLANAYSTLGVILKDLGNLEEAKKLFQKCLEIEPKDFSHISSLVSVLSTLCCWDDIEKYLPSLNRVGLVGKAINPFHLMHIEDNPEVLLKRTIKYSQKWKKQSLPNHTSYNNSKINIGYFSSDFRRHAVSVSFIRVLELHDNSRFNIYAYSLSQINDDYTERVKKAVFCFREVSDLSDIEIVNIARKDKIDIAIDLNGLSKFNRKYIYDYRVAPIQINYFGYPGTMGSKSFDYIIADKIIIPEENKKFFIEKVLYLPNSLMPIDDTNHISHCKSSREELGLPLDGFVFTCFNRIQKITKKEFNIWMRLLKRVDKSVLWIIKPHQSAVENLYSELNKQGIDQERLIFAEKMNLNDHLSRHIHGDLFLDTFNYNAGTTGSLALWAGLPLITLVGKSFSSRAGASFLSACNLSELITNNEPEYESLAYELATNKIKLGQIRKKLGNKTAPFFDTNKYTEDLEKIYTYILSNNSCKNKS